MGRKIDDERLAKVKELIALGTLSHRQIAQAAGVSKGLVQSVKYGVHGAPTAKASRPTAKPFEVYKSGPLGRCPTCGARVYLPCAACRLRGDQ